MAKKVAVLAVNPVNGFGLFQYLEAFFENGISYKVYAVAETKEIKTNSGIELVADDVIANLIGHEDDFDALVFASGNKFEKVAEKEFTYDIKENTFKGFDEEIEFPAQEAVKVKIEFTSGGKIRNGIDCYSPHDKSEVPSTMALDEIEIY